MYLHINRMVIWRNITLFMLYYLLSLYFQGFKRIDLKSDYILLPYWIAANVRNHLCIVFITIQNSVFCSCHTVKIPIYSTHFRKFNKFILLSLQFKKWPIRNKNSVKFVNFCYSLFSKIFPYGNILVLLHFTMNKGTWFIYLFN